MATTVQPRFDYRKGTPDPIQAMYALEKYLASCGLDHKFVHLLKLRASQINGCAFCVDMHSIDARAEGESEQRLYALTAWRETPFFTDRERAGLAWTEALTLVSETHAPDEGYGAARRRFTEKGLVALTMAIVAINGWNRICVGFRAVPGTYQPQATKSARARG